MNPFGRITVSFDRFLAEFFRKHHEFHVLFIKPQPMCGKRIGDKGDQRYRRIDTVDGAPCHDDQHFMDAYDLGDAFFAKKAGKMAFAVNRNEKIPEVDCRWILGHTIKKDISAFEIVRGCLIAVFKKQPGQLHAFAEAVEQHGFARFRITKFQPFREGFGRGDMTGSGIQVQEGDFLFHMVISV